LLKSYRRITAFALIIVLLTAPCLGLAASASPTARIEDVSISAPIIYPQQDKTEDLTSVTFNLTESTRVLLKIHWGKTVFIKDQLLEAGTHSLAWNGRDENGLIVPEARYFITIETQEDNYVHKWQNDNWYITVMSGQNMTSEMVNSLITDARFLTTTATPGEDGRDKAVIKFTLTDPAIIKPVINSYPAPSRYLGEKFFSAGEHYITWDLTNNYSKFPAEPADHEMVTFALWVSSPGIHNYGSYVPLVESPGSFMKINVDTGFINPRWAATTIPAAPVKAGPDLNTPTISTLTNKQFFLVDWYRYKWYRVTLSDGSKGYLPDYAVKPISLTATSFIPTQAIDPSINIGFNYETDGNTIIYMNGYDPQSMYIKNLNTGVRKTINKSGYTMWLPSLNGNYAAWLEKEGNAASQTSTYVVLFNLSTGQETRLGDYLSSYCMAGDYIVYRRDSNLFLYRISSGQTTLLMNSEVYGNNQVITDGRYVLWNTHPHNLWCYDISTSTKKLISDNADYGWINRDRIIFTTSTGGRVEIYNISTSEFTNLFQFSKPLENNGTPTLDGNLVIYADYRHDPIYNYGRQVYIYDLINKKSFALTNDALLCGLNIKGNKAFYSANSQLLMQELSLRNNLPAEAHPPNPVGDYDDMQYHWARIDTTRLSVMGVVSGYPDGTFKPENNISRAELAVILARALQLKSGNINEAGFRDVAQIPAWAQGSVAALVKEGLLRGYPVGDGTYLFRPNQLATRAELAVLLAALLERHIGPTDVAEHEFVDANDIPDWSMVAVNKLCQRQIINGYPDSSFRPNNNVSRAEAATMVNGLLESFISTDNI